MWRLIWFLQGYVQAELRGASPEWALERLSNARVAPDQRLLIKNPPFKQEWWIFLLERSCNLRQIIVLSYRCYR